MLQPAGSGGGEAGERGGRRQQRGGASLSRRHVGWQAKVAHTHSSQRSWRGCALAWQPQPRPGHSQLMPHSVAGLTRLSATPTHPAIRHPCPPWAVNWMRYPSSQAPNWHRSASFRVSPVTPLSCRSIKVERRRLWHRGGTSGTGAKDDRRRKGWPAKKTNTSMSARHAAGASG